MKLARDDFDPRYQHILDTCTPYLLTYPGNLGALDRAPFGWDIAAENTFDPTRLSSRRVVDGLHHLDAFSFGDQEMLMPRWVLFDCGEFPGIVFGFGRRAKDCPPDVRAAYRVAGDDDDDVYVPLSMWVAIRCAEDGAWFGHNLSSANLVSHQEKLPGLATITKSFGVKVAQVSTQYGATQWDSSSLGIHLSLGAMTLMCAYTPAHTHDETFAYRIDVDDDRLTAPLRPGFARPASGGDRHIDAGDTEAIRGLHTDIESGARYELFRIERRDHQPQRLWLKAHH